MSSLSSLSSYRLTNKQTNRTCPSVQTTLRTINVELHRVEYSAHKMEMQITWKSATICKCHKHKEGAAEQGFEGYTLRTILCATFAVFRNGNKQLDTVGKQLKILLSSATDSNCRFRCEKCWEQKYSKKNEQKIYWKAMKIYIRKHWSTMKNYGKNGKNKWKSMRCSSHHSNHFHRKDVKEPIAWQQHTRLYKLAHFIGTVFSKYSNFSKIFHSLKLFATIVKLIANFMDFSFFVFANGLEFSTFFQKLSLFHNYFLQNFPDAWLLYQIFVVIHRFLGFFWPFV